MKRAGSREGFVRATGVYGCEAWGEAAGLCTGTCQATNHVYVPSGGTCTVSCRMTENVIIVKALGYSVDCAANV